MGYKLAGCDVIGANDIDPQMAWHYKRNLKPKHYFLAPVKELLSYDFPDEFYSLDILDGSPPCSTFSRAGNREKDWGKNKHFREGQCKQVLSELFFDYLDLVEKLKPKVAIAENVKGMVVGKAKGYVKAIFKRFQEIGYTVQVFLVNAADCGVPQARERVFFCAKRNDINRKELILGYKTSHISVSEAIDDIVLTPQEMIETKIKSHKQRILLANTAPGNNFEEANYKFFQSRSYFNNYKLHSDKPSKTLTASWHNFYHYKESRYLCYREWLRLGSFPEDYAAKNTSVGKYIIGMSVPPKMIQTIASAVIDQWL